MSQPVATSAPTRPAARPPAHPTSTKPYKYSLADRLYLPLLRGMMVTARHFFKNLVKSKYTISYPEERRPYSGRYRGHHILTTRPDGSVRCVACFLCSTNCPAECIHIEAGEQPDVNIEKYPVVYEIDMLRCVFCGYCVDACPEEAILMSRENDLVGTSREELIIDRDRLMARAKLVEYGQGYSPTDHDVRRPVRIAALERLKTEHGIVPGPPKKG